MTGSLVIIGTGIAGVSLAKEVRKLDAETDITLISADSGDYYYKPNLSIGLTKDKTADELVMTPAATLAEQVNATLLTHTEVIDIDTASKTITTRHKKTKEQQSHSYQTCVLATGASPIVLPFAKDVQSVNDLDDYRQYRTAIEGKQHIGIIGAGLIGCEFAHDLTEKGLKVSLFDINDRPLAELTPPSIGEAIHLALSGRGVDFYLNETVTQITPHAKESTIETASGQTITCDVVLSAVGLKPNTQLADNAGIKTNRGVVVDKTFKTSDDSIYALGDCAEINGYCLQYVMPITQGAKALAKTICTEPTEVSYPPMPVVVKTPSCPVISCLPPKDATGQWQTEGEGTNQKALFTNPEGQLLGFALSGKYAAERMALTHAVPSLF